MLPEPKTPTSKIIHSVYVDKKLQNQTQKRQQSVKYYENKLFKTSQPQLDIDDDYSSSLCDLITPSRTRIRTRSVDATPTKLKTKRRKLERRDITNLEDHESNTSLTYLNQDFSKPVFKRNEKLEINVKINTGSNEDQTDQSSDECTLMNDRESFRSIPSTQTTPEAALTHIYNKHITNKMIEEARKIRPSKKRAFDEVITDSEPVKMTVKRKKTKNNLTISKEAVILITTSLLSVIYGYCHNS